MRIIMASVPKELIRAEQSGDWSYGPDLIMAFVLEDCIPESQLAILIHELIEAFLCRKSGVSDKEVCAFDALYEKERQAGQHGENHEPGDDPRAPYREEHMAATHVERAVCLALGLTWEEHEKEIE